jgi:hypothetical protein
VFGAIDPVLARPSQNAFGIYISVHTNAGETELVSTQLKHFHIVPSLKRPADGLESACTKHLNLPAGLKSPPVLFWATVFVSGKRPDWQAAEGIRIEERRQAACSSITQLNNLN